MSQILDQKQLDELICTTCHKYLSVLPVKQYEKGITKCGRCCKPGDGGVLSPYNKLAEGFLFKCINSYSGCRKLLKVNEVLLHEKHCLSESYNCPTCFQRIIGSYQLLQHYRNQHKRNIFVNHSASFPISDEASYNNFIYTSANFIFFVFVYYFPYYKKLDVCTFSLNDYGKILYKIKAKNNDGHEYETGFQACLTLRSIDKRKYSAIQFETKPTSKIILELTVDSTAAYDAIPQSNCGSVQDKQSLLALQQFPAKSDNQIQLSSMFEHFYPEYKLSPCGTVLISSRGIVIQLTCSNCKHMMGSNVYFCANSHLVCWQCKSWCGVCESPISGRNKNISSMADYILFPCRWKCSTLFSGSELHSHELICNSNKKRCPVCSKYFHLRILIDHLKKHFRLIQGYYLTHEFNFTNFRNFVENLGNRNAIAFFLQNHILVSIKCEFHAVYRKSFKEQMIISYRPVDSLKNGEFCVVIDSKERHNLINYAYVKMESNLKFYLKF